MTQPTIQLTSFGHSCILLEVMATEGPRRVLLDPGNLSQLPDEGLAVDAVLVTHAHPDHLDVDQLSRIANIEHVPIHAPESAIGGLSEANYQAAAMSPGRYRDLPGLDDLDIEVFAHAHATIYPGLPLPDNLALSLGTRVFAPGDSLQVPQRDVDILLAPLGAPWLKLSECIDFVRAVAPKTVVPVHDAGLGVPHQNLHRELLRKFVPGGTEVVVLERGHSVRL